MAKILRKIDQKRNWDSDSIEWLKECEVQSDVAGHCLKTKQNKLSVFKVEDDGQPVQRVVAALALTRESLCHLDFAIVPDRVLEDCKITTCNHVEATTPDSEVNNWHIDLEQLSVTNISDLAKAIKSHGEISRIQQNCVKQAIQNSLNKKWINTEKINERLRDSLKRKGWDGL